MATMEDADVAEDDGTLETLEQLTGFQRDCLMKIVGLDEPSGEDVKQAVQKLYSKPVNHGRLYPNLDTLVNLELVIKGERDRRTNKYEPTPKAIGLLKAQRDELDDVLGL